MKVNTYYTLSIMKNTRERLFSFKYRIVYELVLDLLNRLLLEMEGDFDLGRPTLLTGGGDRERELSLDAEPRLLRMLPRPGDLDRDRLLGGGDRDLRLGGGERLR